MSPRPRYWVDQACTLRAEGRTLSEIALIVGRDHTTVAKAVKGIAPRKTVAIEHTDIQIPHWVLKADLVTDFRDIARTADEFAAAAHCRSLLREARAS